MKSLLPLFDDRAGIATAQVNQELMRIRSFKGSNFENNRRYHKFQEGRYSFPNDDLEQEREDMKHAMVVNLCNGRLHFAPLENPQNILDVGTGTGIWPIDSESA